MKKEQKIYRYTLRLNEGIHKDLSERARTNGRTLNSEIMEIIKEKLESDNLKKSTAIKQEITSLHEIFKNYEGFLKNLNNSEAAKAYESLVQNSKIISDMYKKLTEPFQPILQLSEKLNSIVKEQNQIAKKTKPNPEKE